MAHDAPTIDALARAQAALEDEHQRLRGLVARMRETTEPAALAAVLDELHGQLQAHFEHEEFPGGLYQSMGALGAAHAAEIRDLVDQHFLLLAAVRGLADRARRAAPPASAELLRDAAGVADRLRAHEAKEHQMVDELRRAARPG